jgi:hypothetical protein
MKTSRKILAVMICAGTILSLAACGGITTRVTETTKATQVTESPATETQTTTQPAETQGSIQLQISEHKTGYSIAGKPLPEQNQSKEFTLAKDGKIYEGLSDKADDYSRCILTITDIADDKVTVMLLENGQEVSKDINFNTEYTYTAFINPDEYSYEYTIKLEK